MIVPDISQKSESLLKVFVIKVLVAKGVKCRPSLIFISRALKALLSWRFPSHNSHTHSRIIMTKCREKEMRFSYCYTSDTFLLHHYREVLCATSQTISLPQDIYADLGFAFGHWYLPSFLFMHIHLSSISHPNQTRTCCINGNSFLLRSIHSVWVELNGSSRNIENEIEILFTHSRVGFLGFFFLSIR